MTRFEPPARKGSAPIRVLLFSSFAERGRGGQESLFHLACGLRSFRVSPHVLVPSEGSLSRSLRAQGLEVHVLDLPRIGAGSAPRVAGALYRLLRLVDRLGIDLFHTDGPRNTVYAGLVGRLRRRPVIWHVRASTPDPYDPLLSRLSSRMVLVAEALKSRFPSPAERRKIRVIHNGVDVHRFRPKEERGPAECRTAGTALRIGTVSRVEQEKGILTLLEALGRLGRAAPAARLLVAGGCPDPAYWHRCLEFCRQAGIGGRVEFLGALHPAEDFLRALDIFVLPSASPEAFPRAVLEAMACGKPVVATAGGGIPEAVEEGRTGFIVPPQEPEAMADRLRRLIEDPGLRLHMGRCGRRRAEALFGLEKNTARTARVYEELWGAR